MFGGLLHGILSSSIKALGHFTDDLWQVILSTPALSRGCRWGRYHKKNIASVQIGCLVEQASNAVLQKSELKVLDPISKTEKMLDCTNAWDINLDVSLFSVTTRKATPQSNFNGDSVFNFYAYNLKFVLNFQNYNFDPNFAFSWIY